MERMAITGFQLLFVLVGKIFRPNKIWQQWSLSMHYSPSTETIVGSKEDENSGLL